MFWQTVHNHDLLKPVYKLSFVPTHQLLCETVLATHSNSHKWINQLWATQRMQVKQVWRPIFGLSDANSGGCNNNEHVYHTVIALALWNMQPVTEKMRMNACLCASVLSLQEKKTKKTNKKTNKWTLFYEAPLFFNLLISFLVIQTDHDQCEGEDKGFSHTPSLSSHCAYNCLQKRVNLCYYMVIMHTTLSIVNNGTPRYTDLLLLCYLATLTKEFSNFGINRVSACILHVLTRRFCGWSLSWKTAEQLRWQQVMIKPNSARLSSPLKVFIRIIHMQHGTSANGKG